MESEMDPVAATEMTRIKKAAEDRNIKCEELLNYPDIMAEILHAQPYVGAEFGISQMGALSALEFNVKKIKGSWNKRDEEKLQRNWTNYLACHPIENPYNLLSSRLLDKHKRKKILQIQRNTSLFYQLGEGIPRPLFTVYRKARELFHPYRLKGKLSSEEETALHKLHSIHGNKWTFLGMLIKRPSTILLMHHSNHKNGRCRGAWTEEEVHQLVSAVKEYIQDSTSGFNSTNLYYGLPWTSIASQVPSRNQIQCRSKWLNIICFNAMQEQPKERWTKKDTLLLFNSINDSNVLSEQEINWDGMMKLFPNKAASPQYLHRKWYELKRRVPQYTLKELGDLLEILQNTYIVNLERTVDDHKEASACGTPGGDTVEDGMELNNGCASSSVSIQVQDTSD